MVTQPVEGLECCLVSWGIGRLIAGLDLLGVLGHTLVLDISSVSISIGNIADNLKLSYIKLLA